MTGKNIILLCDGTGNSAASLAKTNVWRLYQALDLTTQNADGSPLQIARYSDGVGTSSFRPLALLGGVFGFGLARNVIDMYKFFCRNYEAGDRIYAFGFSRGAFTARLLIDLICDQGVIRHANDEELDLLAADAWRTYRRQYKLPLWGGDRDYTAKDRDKTVGLVDVLRNLRDGLLRSRRRRRLRYSPRKNERVQTIRFIGVWDTVAAYGLPVDELTRGIDDWVWPLSMTNYRLSDKVTTARHALALDEERDSFHPLLWEEPREGKPSRTDLLQVWFPGVHSNIGGGYPDDTLSLVPLEWMKQEAITAGLTFLPTNPALSLPSNPLGRMYDSRGGVAGYYRLQPRKLRALLHDPPPDTALLQDPKQKGKGFLKSVIVHHSTIDRIRDGTDRYAPFGLPRDFFVLHADGSILPWAPLNGSSAQERENRQEWVWNDVWRRRVTYFTTVLASFLLAAFPWFEPYLPSGECVGPQCLLSPFIEGAGHFLPSFTNRWIKVFAAHPGIFLLLCIIILALMKQSQILRHRVWDRSRRIWGETLGLRVDAAPSTPRSLPKDWVYRLRSSKRYQRFMQRAKWQWISGAFGASVLLLGCLAILSVPVQAVSSVSLLLGWTCRDEARERNRTPFRTNESCYDTGAPVLAGETYLLKLAIDQTWFDDTIPATPQGNVAAAEPWWMPLFTPFRRHPGEPWFALTARVGASGWQNHRLDWLRNDRENPEIWIARLKPSQSGKLFIYVNDAPFYYTNNIGSAILSVERISDS